jgi:hypothetical protein
MALISRIQTSFRKTASGCVIRFSNVRGRQALSAGSAPDLFHNPPAVSHAVFRPLTSSVALAFEGRASRPAAVR